MLDILTILNGQNGFILCLVLTSDVSVNQLFLFHNHKTQSKLRLWNKKKNYDEIEQTFSCTSFIY